MPEPEFITFELPDGQKLEFPSSMDVSERNKIIEDTLVQMGFAEEGATVKLPMAGRGAPNVYTKPSTVRNVTNIGAESLPGLIPGGGVAAVVARGLLAPVMRKAVAEPIQKALGVEPEEFGVPEAVGLAGLSMVGEGAVNLGSRALTGLIGSTARLGGKATKEEIRRTDRLYLEAGFPPPSPAVAAQSKGFQGAIGYTEKSIYSAGKMDAWLSRIEQETLEAIKNITPRAGIAPTVGVEIGKGPRRAQSKFFKEARNLFGAFRRLAPKDLQVQIPATRNLLDKTMETSLAGVATAAGGTKLVNIATKIDRAMAQGTPIMFEDLERVRSFVGRQIAKTTNRAERGEMKELWKRLTIDMENALTNNPQVSDDALKAWRAARAHYKEGIGKIDDFYAKINKKITPDDVTYEVERYINGQKPNYTRLREIRGTLTDEEWEPFQHYFLRKMMMTADESEFLGWTGFLNSAVKMDDEMRSIVWGDGELRRQFDRFVKIARGEKRYGTPTVSKNPLMVLSELSAPVAGAGGAIALSASPLMIVLGAAAYPLTINRSAALLTSPKFLSWMSEGINLPPNKIAQHLGRLVGLAAYEDAETQEAIVELINSMGERAQLSLQPMSAPGLLGRQ